MIKFFFYCQEETEHEINEYNVPECINFSPMSESEYETDDHEIKDPTYKH